MVHGNPSWSIYFRELIKALRGEFRCVAPDHIGMGRSDKPGDRRYPYTLQSRVDDLDALLEYLGIRENVTLVLHDWGGMIGMAYAARHPERIKRLVILNTGAFHLPASKPFPWPLWLTRTPLGALLVRGFNMFAWMAAREGCKRTPMSPELRAAYTWPYDSWANRIATLRFVQDIPLKRGDRAYEVVSGVQATLPNFTNTPLLLCWGLKDFVFDKHFLDEWTRRFPKAEVHRFEDCGHYILEDASAEVIAKIQAFLKAHPLQSAAP
ncbi:MAG: alpha/beta fold hydrolase [Planctomycetes bacterium]|nr:alpha/beta fold hydrolase [Planctomycetota bacterium]